MSLSNARNIFDYQRVTPRIVAKLTSALGAVECLYDRLRAINSLYEDRDSLIIQDGKQDSVVEELDRILASARGANSLLDRVESLLSNEVQIGRDLSSIGEDIEFDT